MAKRLGVISRLRPRIASQGVVDLEKLAGRITKSTTFHRVEIESVLRLFVEEAVAALQTGETVKIDDLLRLRPNMRLDGAVDMTAHPDRGAVAQLNNPALWTAGKLLNHGNRGKTADELVALWNAAHPGDPVEE